MDRCVVVVKDSARYLKPRESLGELLLFDARNRNVHFVGHDHIAAISPDVAFDVAHIDQKLFVYPEKICTAQH